MFTNGIVEAGREEEDTSMMGIGRRFAAVALLLVVAAVAFGCGSSQEPAAAPTLTATPPVVADEGEAGHQDTEEAEGHDDEHEETEEGDGHASEAPVGAAARGQAVFVDAGWAACHGQDAEGTAVAPALTGHTEAQVRRQVRAPVGLMLTFSPDLVTDDQLDDLGAEMEMHHWMALTSIQGGNIVEARHHVQHIVDLTVGDHRVRMLGVLEALKADDLHEAAHDVEAMLAGVLRDGVGEGAMHLQMALAASRMGDAEAAHHHLTHFQGVALRAEVEMAETMLELAHSGDLVGAQHEIVELLEARGVDVGRAGMEGMEGMDADAHEEGDEHDAAEAHDAHEEGHEITAALAPLMEAVEAIRMGDLEAAAREIRVFIESASGMDRIMAEAALGFLEGGDLHEAEHALEELMGMTTHED
jgi:hypothetical protein